MRFFIVKEENAAYYYARYKGICRKNLQSLHSGDEIYPQGTDGFALLRNRTTHIICANKNNDIIYINNPREPHLLIKGSNNVMPYDFTLSATKSGVDLFYKTDYNNRVLLYRCSLQNTNKPHIIAELSPEFTQYYCGYGKMFYTSPEGILYGVITDTNASTPICVGGTIPCYAFHNGQDLLVYIKDGVLYFNKQPLAEDKYGEQPVILCISDIIYIQWKSGDFIKYKRFENNKWSDTVQVMGTDTSPHIINTVIDMQNYPCYGYNGRPCIKF